MHIKHLIIAVVYDRFLFHASIESKLATDKPTGGYAYVGLYRATDASIFHSSSMNGSAASPYSQ